MNLYGQLQRGVLPRPAIQVAKVIEHRSDGRTSIVQFPGGSQINVRGQTVAVDSHCFVRDGEIIGEAPAIDPAILNV